MSGMTTPADRLRETLQRLDWQVNDEGEYLRGDRRVVILDRDLARVTNPERSITMTADGAAAWVERESRLPHPHGLRAWAAFDWTFPGESKPTRYRVELYESNSAPISGTSPYGPLCVAATWEPSLDAINDASGYWAQKWDDDTRKGLMLKATNALRRKLGLPPHPMTAAWPGTE